MLTQHECRKCKQPLCVCPGTITVSAVDHPNHYTWHPTTECIKVSQHFNFNLGNVIKYTWRAGAPVPKESRKQDLLNARKYIDFELERLDEEHRPEED